MDELLEILGPPTPRRVRFGPGEWERAEAALGIKLPSDYERFIEVYGEGIVDRFVIIFSPFWNEDAVNLVSAALNDPEGMGILRRKHPDSYPFSRFPRRGGLLPFGRTINGDVLYWKTKKGDPDTWPVIVYEGRGDDYVRFDGPMTKWLAAILSGRLRCRVFPANFPSAKPAFEPHVS